MAHSRDSLVFAHDSYAVNFRVVIAACAISALVGCDRSAAPQRSRLDELRLRSTAARGAFFGRVVTPGPAGRCHARIGKPIPNAVVEVGLWDGSPRYYKDTTTLSVPTSLDEPRFLFLASTTTDSAGRFRLTNYPRGESYAMRAIPPRDGPWRLGYGESLFGPPEGGDLQDFPTLCVAPR